MAVMQTVARIRVGAGAAVERLVCHPRLPLVAGPASGSPAVRIWDCAGQDLREIGIIDRDRMPRWRGIRPSPCRWRPARTA
ncbi:hypothetical protein [Actinoplanes auranticolor]|uniref:Uncharacterized protein n=1 Tax=Actinoplanes auranticolor TaxID=47988 RepID=A0A919S996_9ACTN|nr:hypothetical protein [Actinoplanes auranticolor]GIM67162.1 hypothetical protein Aau02nite_26180 [Actinoplanes auranticolor]